MNCKPTDPRCQGNMPVWSRVTALFRLSLSPMTTSEQSLIRPRDAPKKRVTVDSITKPLSGLCLLRTLLFAAVKKSFVSKRNFDKKGKHTTMCLFMKFQNVWPHMAVCKEIRAMLAWESNLKNSTECVLWRCFLVRGVENNKGNN